MNKVVFTATVLDVGSHPQILKFYNVGSSIKVFDVDFQTIQRALLNKRMVHGKPSNMIIAGRNSKYFGLQVILLHESGLISMTKKKSKPVASLKNTTKYYLTNPNKSTSTSSVYLQIFEHGKVIQEVCGFPQAVRTVIDMFPDELDYLKENDDKFHNTVTSFIRQINRTNTAMVSYDGRTISIKRVYRSMVDNLTCNH